MKRIGELYRIEAELHGLDADTRLTGRQARSTPLITVMRASLTHHCARVVAGKSPLSEALAYIAKFWDGLCIFLTDGRIEIDNNSVERTIRPIALNRKNALFAGHDAGARNWATIASLIETCKLNAVDPMAYMTATLTAIVNGHKQSRVGELLPWSFIARKDLPKKSLLGKGRRTQLEVTLPWCRVTRFDERPRCRCNKCILHWQPCPFLGSHVAVAGQVGLDEAGADRIHDDAGLFQFLVQLDR